MHPQLPADLCLEGEVVRLEPLSPDHHDGLVAASQDGDVYKIGFSAVPSAESMADYIDNACENRLLGSEFPFAVIRKQENGQDQVVGCTRFYDISLANRNLAIGYTWYGKSAQRTVVNTETKLLLLTHIFEQMNCIGVTFHVHHQNIVSQTAVKRLGAKLDGILRNHRILPDGSLRDTYCFSIIDTEWEQVKVGLLSKLSE